MNFLDWNQRGLIPGPQESEEAFLKRVARSTPCAVEAEWQDSARATRKLFDFSIDWVKVFFSDKDLPFWQGAATWIEEEKVSIQLKQTFRSGSHLRIYKSQEVLAHEALHAARFTFNEPQFEELLAYQTSANRWRRWLGPLFEASWESYLLLCLLLVSLLAQSIEITIATHPLLTLATWLPWMGMGAGLCRLFYRHFLLQRCLQNLKKTLKHPEQSLAVACRLTDREIRTCAHLPPSKIADYLSQENSLRCRQIQAVYFNRL